MVLQTKGKRPYTVDKETNQITFLDQRFYELDGAFYPSVTTYLEAYPKSAQFMEWLKKNGEDADTIRDEAGRRGSVVHNLTERYDLGEEINLLTDDLTPQCKSSEWAMFERYVEFTTRFSPEIEAIESRVVSPILRAAGTVDRILTLAGKRYLVDIKTSNAVHETYWMQLAAYRQMLEEYDTHVDAVAVLWLNAKTKTEGKGGAIQGKGWQLISQDDTTKELEIFKAVQEVWHACNEDYKPRNISYCTKYKKVQKAA